MTTRTRRATSRLLADVGGTHTRLALQRGRAHLEHPATLDNAHYPDLTAAIEDYLAGIPGIERPCVAGIAIASPVSGDRVELTNRDWHFSQAQLAQQLGLEALEVCNDFAAIAWSLPYLEPADYTVLGSAPPRLQDVLAVIGPGTGLGVATLVRNGDDWQVLPGEGGHVTLAAMTDAEDEIIRLLRRRFGHVSAERVLSGPGLSYLYDALAELHNADTRSASPEAIVTMAANGDAMADECLALFFALLGTVAGDLALTVGARGGVYLAGGILSRLAERLSASQFRDRFVTKGRFSDYLQTIPTVLITQPTPAIIGLAAYLDRLGIA